MKKKLKRANQHLDALEHEIERWLSTDPYIVIDQIDSQTGENAVRICRKESTPPSISVIAGDVIHNLRCALDHLVYALADSYQRMLTHKPFILGDVTGTQFPIFHSWEEFCNRGTKFVRRIHPDAQAIICGLQPCTAVDPQGQWLWQLRELSNIDKHRTLNATLDVHAGTNLFPMPGGGFIEYLRTFGRLRSDQSEAEIARYKAYSSPDQTMRVQVNLKPVAEVGFGYGLVEGRHVLNTLKGIRSYIGSEVIPLLTPFL